jgi:hypothetical protein
MRLWLIGLIMAVGLSAQIVGIPGANLRDATGNEVATATAAPAGTERGLIVRNITSGTQNAAGDTAHDAVDSGNPLGIGLNARTTNPVSVADGDRVRAIGDKSGSLVVTLNNVRELTAQNTITLSTTTETTLLTAGAAGVFHDLTFLSCTNTSATLARVDIRDATAGTVRQSWAVAASGGGFTTSLLTPFTQTTAANNWTAQLSTAVTDVRCNVSAVKKL